MKVILTAQDLLPMIKDLLATRYPKANKVRVQFVMKRLGWFSTSAEITVECELEE